MQEEKGGYTVRARARHRVGGRLEMRERGEKGSQVEKIAAEPHAAAACSGLFGRNCQLCQQRRCS